MNPGGNFANGAVSYTIIFKVSAFQLFNQKLVDVRPWSDIVSSILITIIVEDLGFRNTITVIMCSSLFTVHSEHNESL